MLRAFPAARLARVRGVKEPRPRHHAHLGDVRLKEDFRWWAGYQNGKDIGGFEVPWGPFGFNSGVDQRDVSRREAIKLGLIRDDDPGARQREADHRVRKKNRGKPARQTERKRTPGKITDNSKASTKGLSEETKRKLETEIRKGPQPRTPMEAARRAAAEARKKVLGRMIADAEARGDSKRAMELRGTLAEVVRKYPGALDVRIEGDTIRLGEGIGQRLSKVRPEGAATPEQERAIAEAVFESIDRKAAEPKTRRATGKGANRARHLHAEELTLTPEERKILESPHEILLVHDENGRLKSATLGGREFVSIPVDIPAGATLSHNHPSGRGPSDGDLKAVLMRPGVTLRIATVNENGRIELFYLRAGGEVSPEVARTIAKEYGEICIKNGDTPNARREALILINEQYPGKLIANKRIFP